jgi:hypothetical protein
VDEGGATDFTFKAALFSAVFFSDLVLAAAPFSL